MRKLAKLDNLTKEEWLAKRRLGIGGSDIAGVVGLSKYKSPLSIFLDKTNQLPNDDKENIAAELGLELEPFLSKKFVKWIAENEGLDIEIKKMPWILQHDTVDYFLVNLDRFFKHPQRGYCPVEIKTTTEFKRELWEGNKVPDEYYAQVQWQLYITGWQWCYLIFLIGNRTLDVKLIERNEEVIKNLANKGKEFWTGFVEKNIPPAPIGLSSDEIALKILYPNENPEKGIELAGSEVNEILEMIDIIDEQKEIEKKAKGEKIKAQQIIKAKIGDNEYIVAGDKKITYKTVQIKEHMVGASQYRKLHIGGK